MTTNEIKMNLIKTLKYIINRNNDVITTDSDEREYIEYKYYFNWCGVFFVLINNEFFDINFTTTVENAKKLLSYIQNKKDIVYLCDRNNSFDTFVGDIEKFMDDLKITNLTDCSYLRIIENIGTNYPNLTKKMVTDMLLAESKCLFEKEHKKE